MLMSLWVVDVGEAHESFVLEKEACMTFMTLISNLESWRLVSFVEWLSCQPWNLNLEV
jgi:hypothetical protein